MSINDGAPFTNQVTVTLQIKAPVGVPQMMVSRDGGFIGAQWEAYATTCLLYTSDAADDLLCVDLGGRRIIKKKTKNKLTDFIAT